MTNAGLVNHTSVQAITRKQQQILLSKFNKIKIKYLKKIQFNCKLNCWCRYRNSDSFILHGRNNFCAAVACTGSHLCLCCSRLHRHPPTSLASYTSRQPHFMMMMNIEDSFQTCPCLDSKHYPALLQYIALPTSKWSCFKVRHDTALLLQE